MPLVQYYKYVRILKARRRRRPEWQREAPPDTPVGREAYKIAAQYENRFARAFLEMTNSLLTRKTAIRFKDVWNSGTVETVMSVFPFFGEDIQPEVWENFTGDLVKAYSLVVDAAGKAATQDMNKKFGLNMEFSLVEKAKEKIRVVPINPYSIEWIKNRALELVTQGVTDHQLKVVRDMIGQGFEAGLRAEDAYEEIKANIGLTEREYGAVINRRILHQEAGLPETEVERLVNKYRQKLLKGRAMRIARTETMFAQGQGRQASWEMARDKGILPEVERRWVAVPSACDICGPLDGTTAKLGGSFEAGGVSVEGAPAHPNCGCTEILQQVKE